MFKISMMEKWDDGNVSSHRCVSKGTIPIQRVNRGCPFRLMEWGVW